MAGLTSVLARARRAAQRRSQRVSTGHVLLVMLQSGQAEARLLAAGGVREGDLLTAIKTLDDEPQSALEVAFERAHKLAGKRAPTSAHLLLALVRDSRTVARRCLEELGAKPGTLREALEGSLLGRSELPARPRSSAGPVTPLRTPVRKNRRVRTAVQPRPSARAPRVPAKGAIRTTDEPMLVRPESSAEAAPNPYALDPKRFPVLSKVGRNLTELAADDRLDPVIGREAELEQLLDTLARRRSNNPILVGPPGVGKSAIVEGLALRLAQNEGVRGLEDRILVEVSAGSLVANTGVRGALAERMRALRTEVARSDGRVLLFLDETHAVIGGDGPDDLASELKAALARGELPCIGATTEAEFRRHFDRDPALARRFWPIRIGEPSKEMAREVLSGLVERYEDHHGVSIRPEAIRAAVDLSVRFVPERQLPDKAIALLDQAAARVGRRGAAEVDRRAVAQVLSDLQNVPIERMLDDDRGRLLDLEQTLAARVVGHLEPIARVGDILRQGAAGFRGKRPLGTFLLLGPSGVGKTEMAKAVADAVFPEGSFTRFDMSEFSERHAVARLLGAPPGYVGHEAGGQLTESVRRRPYQLVLLDEIEKAHRDVIMALLPLFDEGHLTDARGRTVDFTNTVLFLTSNLGASPRVERSIGFGTPSRERESDEAREHALRTARAALAPELWNRIDEPLYFAPLSRTEVREVARRMLGSLATRLVDERGIELDVLPSALDALVDAGGYDPTLGARPMRRTIARLIEAPLARRILQGSLFEGNRVLIVGEGQEIQLLRQGEVSLEEAAGDFCAAE
ncbi:MAG: ATP-dependent Clp protease ATP-binding subunit [Myxococcota bacterium]